MRCSFCGHEFDETTVPRPHCGACMGGCHGLHCPRCGYRNLPDPSVVKRLRSLMQAKEKERGV